MDSDQLDPLDAEAPCPVTRSSTDTPPTPAVPLRPSRSTLRLSLASSSLLPDTSDYPPPPSGIPPAPPSAYAHSHSPYTCSGLGSRRSSSHSLRRKPVPFYAQDVEPVPVRFSLEGSQVSLAHSRLSIDLTIAGSAPSSAAYARPRADRADVFTPLTVALAVETPTPEPPCYVLDVELPPPVYLSGPASPPSTSPESYPPYSPTSPSSASREDLPIYAAENQTEPQTLARFLWKWGWLFPPLWALGMCILWIPLTLSEEQPDPSTKQKMEEMIVILRKAELRYARRCLWAFMGFLLVLVVTIVAAVVATSVKH